MRWGRPGRSKVAAEGLIYQLIGQWGHSCLVFWLFYFMTAALEPSDSQQAGGGALCAAWNRVGDAQLGVDAQTVHHGGRLRRLDRHGHPDGIPDQPAGLRPGRLQLPGLRGSKPSRAGWRRPSFWMAACLIRSCWKFLPKAASERAFRTPASKLGKYRGRPPNCPQGRTRAPLSQSQAPSGPLPAAMPRHRTSPSIWC